MPVQGMWTDEKVEDLKRRWAAGETTTVIALALGTTRSTISGKIDRLDLQGRPQIAKTPEERAEALKRRNARRVINKRLQRHREDKLNGAEGRPREPKPAPVREPFADSLNIRFGDLRPFFDTVPNQCRFIADDAADPDCTACGNVTAKGEAWCAHHKAIVYRAPIQVSDEDRFRRAINMRKNLNLPQVIRSAASLASDTALT